MDQRINTADELKTDQLLQLHNLTRDVAKFCGGQLRGYLEALAPLFRPRRLLGDHMEGVGRERVVGEDQNFAELQEVYLRMCGRPFELRRELSTPLESVSTQVQLHDWEYVHETVTERGRKSITVVSPLTWVLTYPSTYSLSMLRQVVAGKQEGDQESVRSFVLRACLIHLLFVKQPGLKLLLEGLRYKVEIRNSPQLGDLPLVTVSAPLTTMRPSDELLLVATGLSGRAVFQEVLDKPHARALRDPFEEQISGILG
jgi:hypothetical protein